MSRVKKAYVRLLNGEREWESMKKVLMLNRNENEWESIRLCA